MKSLAISLLLLLPSSFLVKSSLGKHLRDGGSLTVNDCFLQCRLTKLEVIHEHDESDGVVPNKMNSNGGDESLSPSPYFCHSVDSPSFQSYSIDLPPTVVAEHKLEIESGTSRVCIPERFVDADTFHISIPETYPLQILQHAAQKRRLQSENFVGTKKLLAVRVVSDLGEQPDEAGTLVEGTVFGTGVESFTPSVTSQFYDVSHGALQFVPASGTGIQGGVIEVRIPVQVLQADVQKMIMSPAISAVQDIVGLPISSIADHVMFCIPNDSILQGSASWTAFTFLNEGYSVYQKSRCTRISTVMHELGHSIGFKHSGKGTDDYGDTSCYMGYTYNAIGLPMKSYNAYKYWQSGWIDSDRMLEVSPTSGQPKFVRIAAASVYKTAFLDTEDAVIVNVDNLMYIKYNIAKGFDADLSADSADKVSIIEATGATENSYLVAELEAGEMFEFTSPGSSQLRYIKVCEIATSPFDYAKIVITVDASSSGDVCASTPTSSTPSFTTASPEDDLVYAQSFNSFSDGNTLASSSSNGDDSSSTTSSTNAIQGPTIFTANTPSTLGGSSLPGLGTSATASNSYSSFSSLFNSSPVFYRLTHSGEN